MKSVWARTLCRLLMVLMVWSPIQYAHAGMIGTDQVASVASQADRIAVLQFLGRAEVTSQLQSLGVDPATAKDRVAAMTDPEVRSLAGRIQSMPAGADSTGTLLLIVVVAFVVWWVWFRR
ncbi:MAG TPA: PA2779 family protein [Burkholderiales bacterium]|nr:PA2779 family protein [Burkholderiales bacterium]